MGLEHTVLCKMTQEGLADEVTFEQRPENQNGSVGMSLVGTPGTGTKRKE